MAPLLLATAGSVASANDGSPSIFWRFRIAQIEEASRLHHTFRPDKSWIQRNHSDTVIAELMCRVRGQLVGCSLCDTIRDVAHVLLR